MPADAPQPPQDVGEVAAEHAAVGVQLVDHDVAQVLEQLRPARMVRQDPGVQHVRVAQHDVRAGADGAPGVLRRVAVVGEHADRGAPPGVASSSSRLRVDQLDQAVQLGELVLRQRLGRVEIQRARRRILEDRVEDRPVEAQRLARRGRRDDDGAAPGQRVGHRLGLVRVELADAARRQRADQPPIERLGHRRVHRGCRRQPPDGGDHDVARRRSRARSARPVPVEGTATPGPAVGASSSARAPPAPGPRRLRASRIACSVLADLVTGRAADGAGTSVQPAALRDEGGGGIPCGHTVAAAAGTIKRRNQPTPGPFPRRSAVLLQPC